MNIQNEIMIKLVQIEYNQPENHEVIKILKNLENMIKKIIQNEVDNNNNSIQKIKEYIFSNKTTETLYCWFEFETIAEIEKRW